MPEEQTLGSLAEVGHTAEPWATERDIATVEDGSIFDDVPKFGDVLKPGTYTFRIREYNVNFYSAAEKHKAEEEYLGLQPQYSVMFEVTEGPDTGRIVFHNFPWINQTTLELKMNGDEVAKKCFNRRVPSINDFRKLLEFPAGGFTPEKLFSSNLLVKGTTGLEPKKVKDTGSGNFVNSGENKAKIVKFMSVSAV